MSINTVPAVSEARQPRDMVRITGADGTTEVMAGRLSWETDENTFYAADTFHVVFAVSALPEQRGADWWAQQTEVFCEVLAGFPLDADSYTASDLESRVYGRVDEVEFDPVSRAITITGRDLTSLLIDAKTTEKYRNNTASDIATLIAKKYGLTPVVTSTTTKVGAYYEIDQVHLTDERSEWDLLTFVANQENFVVYVKGKELHFEPQPEPTESPYLLRWEPPTEERGYPVFNGKTLSLSRNLTLAKGITVTVRYFNVKTKRSDMVMFPHEAKGISSGTATRFGANGLYEFRLANATPEKALKFAEAKHREITKHEMRMTASMPGDNLLSARNVIQLEGTGTAFDQIYYPESIRRSMSVSEGYTMSVSAKNHAPSNEVSI